jgi:hypothetical protein
MINTLTAGGVFPVAKMTNLKPFKLNFKMGVFGQLSEMRTFQTFSLMLCCRRSPQTRSMRAVTPKTTRRRATPHLTPAAISCGENDKLVAEIAMDDKLMT